jgi:hypothetical protein
MLEVIRGEERDFRQEIRCPTNAEKHRQLEDMIGKGKRSAELLTKSRIVLKTDVSEAGDG